MLLEIQSLTKRYPGSDNARPVLRDVSLSLDAGETLALTGESGSGKSTLLHLIGALDDFDTGEIRLAGQALSGLGESARAALRRDVVALVFQQFNLVPSLTVAQNLAFHARLAGRLDAAWVGELTGRLGLEGLESRWPEQLSGGQQQRVAIGRALAMRPRLLLADEPTGNLDEATSDMVLSLMLDLVEQSGAALFLVTHSERIAGRVGRRAHLSNGSIA
ncbi:ABC transporter ATP-binding protein [Pontibaca methylaminivorans]|uniref:ABC transporter ATP-binding protein n=1 Tax=Pontibaca methylaminivorans TaxID=515897 RepID=UPI002FD8B8CE